MAAPAYLLDTNILLRLSLPGGSYDHVLTSRSALQGRGKEAAEKLLSVVILSAAKAPCI